MPIILNDGTKLDVEKYSQPFNNNQRRYDDNIFSQGERDRRVKDNEARLGEIDLPRNKEEPLEDSSGVSLPKPSVSGSSSSSSSSGVSVDDFDIPRVGEGDILVEIDNWRHAVVYAMAVLKKEEKGFINDFYEVENVYSTALYFRGFGTEPANYLTQTKAKIDFLIDNLNTILEGLGLKLVEKENYAKATFHNLIKNCSMKIKFEDEKLFNVMSEVAIEEEKMPEFLQSFRPSDRRFLKERSYYKCIDKAVNDLRKLGYIKHPKCELLKNNVNMYCAFTGLSTVKRSALLLDGDSYLIHEDVYRLYHILYDKHFFTTREKNIYRIDVRKLTGIDVDKVMQYDEFIVYDSIEGKISEVYQVIEIYKDQVRVLKMNSKKSIEDLRNLTTHLSSIGVKSEQTLTLRDSQYITYKVFYNR